MKTNFEDFLKHVTVKNLDGSTSPLKLTEAQKEYVKFMEWVDEKGYDTALFLHASNLGRHYFHKLYKEYKSAKQ